MKNKSVFVAFMLAIFAVCFVSCSKNDEPEQDYVDIIGTFRYNGNVPEIMDARDFYDVEITANTIITTPMFDEGKSTFKYSRDWNEITINPAMNGKLSSATIIETSAGFGFELADGRILFFDKHERH